ncbi:putative ferritin-1, partial [Haemophilus influenzae]
RRWQRLVPN